MDLAAAVTLIRNAVPDVFGFRNVAVHNYTRLDLAIVQSIVEQRLDDLLRFASAAVRAA